MLRVSVDPAIHFVIKFGKFGLPFFHLFAMDFYETSHNKSRGETKFFCLKRSTGVHFIGALDNAVIAFDIKSSKYPIISFPGSNLTEKSIPYLRPRLNCFSLVKHLKRPSNT